MPLLSVYDYFKSQITNFKIIIYVTRPVAGGGPVCKHMCREFLFIFIISDLWCTGKYEVDFAYPGNK